MFEPSDTPRLFAMPPGADFPRALVAGVRARMAGRPPEDMARVELFVNTRRMQRRVRELFAEGEACLLPRIRLVTDLGDKLAADDLPPAAPPLRRRLELARLVARLIEREPGLAPKSAVHDLAESLAALMDEMQGEEVTPEDLAALDVSDHALHWRRSLAFIGLISDYLAARGGAPDREARQGLAVARLAQRWQVAPPEHPVIVAGSTGSRGTTARLMEAVANLPQGALVLPGFDFDLPERVWNGLDDAMTAEDHPQYRFHALLRRLGRGPGDVARWQRDIPAPNPARNRLISLALRPAPVTDQWMREGRALSDLDTATRDVALIEAPGPRMEALAIALRLRRAAEDGRMAALITPDRELSRQVTAALDRWGIVPDDSAGRPLPLSPPGRFLRHVAGLMGRVAGAEDLLTLLKHPLTHSTGDRGDHLLWTRELELHLRRTATPFPGLDELASWAEKRGDAGAAQWVRWLAGVLTELAEVGEQHLQAQVAHHLALAECLAAGPGGTGAGELWQAAAGAEARRAVDELLREAPHGGHVGPSDYADLFDGIIRGREVRESAQPHPQIMIWGTLEARVQGAGLVILGGLNDGVWPQIPAPDPWLNRQMRHDAGLLLPERQIGLAAHDFQQAVAADEVVLSRSVRDAESETVPSRWLNRLANLLAGLPDLGGDAALEAMRARGARWVGMARDLERAVDPVAPAARPAPRPPVAARPEKLPVTAISRLIRDPYAIYAERVLGLRPLAPLRPEPDALLRGSVIHGILERFMEEGVPPDRAAARARLLEIADEHLASEVHWPLARRLWRARLARVAGTIVGAEPRHGGRVVMLEQSGEIGLDGTAFTLTAKPDRIDELPDGHLHLIDYKSGTPPTEKAQEHFDKQLLLEAAMAERGAFASLGPREVARITYVGLGSTPRDVSTVMTPELVETTWQELHELIARYNSRAQGYAARRAVFGARASGDFDHLARFGEWEMSDPPTPGDVG